MEFTYIEKEFPELLYILEKRDHEIKDLTEKLNQDSIRLEYLELLTERQDTQIKVCHEIISVMVIFIIILLIIIL